MIFLLVTFLVGVAGAILASKVKMPAAFMTGSMFLVIAFSILTGRAYFPTTIKPSVQMIAGGAIGVGMTASAVKGIKRLWLPVLVYVIILMVGAVATAVVVTLVTPLTMVTALLACAPGGIVDMSMLSLDFGGNTSQVTLMQMVRLVMAVGVFPTITNSYLKRTGYQHPEAAEEEELLVSPLQERKPFATIAIAIAGGCIGYWSGLPSATLTGAMLAVAGYQITTGRAIIPMKLRRVAQIAAGAIIGAGITLMDLKQLVYLALPLLLVLVQYSFLNFCVGPWLAKRFDLDLLTMLLACTPGGISDMALIAGDLGGDQSKVAVFQLARLTSVLTIYPAIISLILVLIG